MQIASALAVYIILWWLAFIAVLPFGVRTLEETGELEPGQAPSAPARPMLWRKIVAATVLAAILWFGLYLLTVVAGVTLDDIPFGNPAGT